MRGALPRAAGSPASRRQGAQGIRGRGVLEVVDDYRGATMRSKVPVYRGSENVFADLGFDNPEEMRLRADLVQQLREIIKHRRLTQAATAKLLGIKQPDLSALLHGRLTKYSLERLLRFMTILDRDVEIVVKAKPRHRFARMSVVFS
jgi:predicted XRE-type DNA-binding protein